MGRTILRFQKFATERVEQALDFVKVLEAGETITGRSISAQDEDGTDVTGTVTEAPSGSGTIVQYVLKAGTPGNKYIVDVAATLNTTEILVQRLEMYVPLP